MNKLPYQKVVILANGEYPTHPIPYNLLIDSKYIICCDGAVDNLDRDNIPIHKIIGDLDSITTSLKNKYKHKIIKIVNQNKNDLQKAIEWSIKNDINKLCILGMTGLRDDHTLANIFLILKYSQKLSCKIVTDYGTFHPIIKNTTFESFINQNVSLFCIDPTIKISTTNLKYNLTNQTVSNLYSLSLNSSIDDLFSINISHGSILVYQTHK